MNCLFRLYYGRDIYTKVFAVERRGESTFFLVYRDYKWQWLPADGFRPYD